MYKLKLMNEYEFMKIFGCLEVLLALHQGSILIFPSALIGQLHNDVILLQLPESFSVLFSLNAN